jgi:hypothetical protein
LFRAEASGVVIRHVRLVVQQFAVVNRRRWVVPVAARSGDSALGVIRSEHAGVAWEHSAAVIEKRGVMFGENARGAGEDGGGG